MKLKGVGPALLNRILSSESLSNENIVSETDNVYGFLNDNQIEEFKMVDVELENQISRLEEADAGFISIITAVPTLGFEISLT